MAAADTVKKLNVFVPITKVDAAKGIVYGVLAAEEKDRTGEVFDYKGSKPHFEKWSSDISKATNGKSLGNLRAMHGAVAAGKFTDIHFNDNDKRIEVAAKVVDKAELEKVLEGVYSGFSIGGSYEKRWKDDDGLMRYVANPVEGSLVDLPCIASATFEVIKADGAKELRKFHVAADDADEIIEPTNDEIVTEAKKLAKAAGDESKYLDKLDAAREALKAFPKKKKKSGDDAETQDDDETADDADAEDNEKAAIGGGVQVWQHPELPGQTFAKKALLRRALIDHRANTVAAKAAGPVTDAISQLRKSLDDKSKTVKFDSLEDDDFEPVLKAAGIEGDDVKLFTAGLAKATAEQLASLEAVDVIVAKAETGSGSIFELGDEAKAVFTKLLAAIKTVPVVELTDDEKAELLAKGACLADGSYRIESRDDFEAALASYAEKSTAVAKRHITKRARALKAVDLLPEDWRVVIEKPADLKKIAAPELKKAASLYSVTSLISALAQLESCEESLESPAYGYGTMVPKALCDRMGSAMLEVGNIVAEVLDVILASMTEREAAEAGTAVAQAAIAGELLKFAVDQPLVKAGARHSRVDQGFIDDAHNLLVAAGAMCGEDDDDAEKASELRDLRKVVKSQERAFTKTLGDLMELVQDVAGRVKNIEAAPLPEGTSSVDKRFQTVEKAAGIPDQQGKAMVLKADYLPDPNAAAFATMTAERQRLDQSVASSPAR